MRQTHKGHCYFWTRRHCNSDHLFDFLSKPRPKKIELTDQLDVSPTDSQASSYTFPVDESMAEIKSLIND